LDLFYNGILVVIVSIWVIGLRSAGMGRLVAALKKRATLITVLAWVAFIAFALSFVLYFSYFEEIHDIVDAVEAAVTSVENGVNPYEEYVVPRFKGKYAPDPVWSMGPYNYLPLDLMVYVGTHEVLGFVDAPVWFVVANLVFSGAALYLLRRIIDVGWLSFAPFAGIVMLFYSFDNASLTLLLMIASIYARNRLESHKEAVSIIIMCLAMMTKIYAILPFAVLVLFDLQANVVARNIRKTAEVLVAVAISAAIALLLMLPFGVSNVLDAAVFFHGSEAARVGTSTGGTLLSELAFASDYYVEITVAALAAALFAGLLLRNMNDRVLLVTVVFLLVAIKSSLAPLTVAGVFLALRLWDISCARAVKDAMSDTPQPAPPDAGTPKESASSPSGD
jgi:hypothetical protein